MARKEHIIRAALEAICFQTRDILEAMQQDLGVNLTELYADGVMSQNDNLMQIQADVNGVPCIRLNSRNVIGLGTAMVAGQAAGINLWSVYDSHLHFEEYRDRYVPRVDEVVRQERYRKWKMAVQRALGWNEEKMKKGFQKVLNNIPVTVFFLTLFGLITLSHTHSFS